MVFIPNNKILHRNDKHQFTMSLLLRRKKNLRKDYSLNFTYILIFFLRKIISEYYLSPILEFKRGNYSMCYSLSFVVYLKLRDANDFGSICHKLCKLANMRFLILQF